MGARKLLAGLLMVGLAWVSGAGQNRDSEVSGHVLAADTGAPVVAAKVMLNPPLIAGVYPWRSTETDKDGVYRFASVPAGNFIVTVEAEGFVYQDYKRDTSDSGWFIPLDGTNRVGDIDLRLETAGTVSGTVVEATGAPVGAGVYVAAVQRTKREDGSERRMPASSAETDAEGRFRLKGLSEGRYYVCVDGPDGLGLSPHTGKVTYRETWLGDVATIDEARMVEVRAGHAVADLRIAAPRTELHTLTVEPVWYGVGREGIAKPDRVQSMVQGRNGTSRENPDGTTSIPDLPPGRYTVSSTAWLGAQYVGQGEAQVELADTDARVKVQVGGLGAIAGWVQRLGNGWGAEPLRVAVMSSTASTGAVVAGDDGGFVIDRVLPGEYTVRVFQKDKQVTVAGVQCGGVETPKLVVASEQRVKDCVVRVTLETAER